MAVPNTRAMIRRPTHPGELLRGRRAVSPEMALRLSRLLGNTAEFWMNAQRTVDLWDALWAVKDDVARITPLRVA